MCNHIAKVYPKRSMLQTIQLIVNFLNRKDRCLKWCCLRCINWIPSLVTFCPLAQDASLRSKKHRCPFSADGRDLSPSTMDVDYEDDAVEVRESKCFFSRRLHGYFFSPRNGSVENGCIWKVTTIGDTPIFHWTMIVGGRENKNSHDCGRKGKIKLSVLFQPLVIPLLGGGFKHFLFLPLTWGNDPIWLIFFRWGWMCNLFFTPA